MTQETIAVFTRKIASANRSELICILYEIYFAYEEEAREYLAKEGPNVFMDDATFEQYVHAIRQCGQVIRHLKESLDFTYPISYRLYQLYDFAERKVAQTMYERKVGTLDEARKVMAEMQEAFLQVAETDDTPPVMGNAQQVTAGLTYGRQQLNESMAESQTNRGYWA